MAKFELTGKPTKASPQQIKEAENRFMNSQRFIFPLKDGTEIKKFLGLFIQPATSDGEKADYLVFRLQTEDGKSYDLTRKFFSNREKIILMENVIIEGLAPSNEGFQDVAKRIENALNDDSKKVIAHAVPDFYSSGVRRNSDFGVITIVEK